MLAWKCGRNGEITERTGAVTFKNFKIADSGIAGIEFSVIEGVADGDANIKGGIVVGNTYLNDDDGVLNPRYINQWIKIMCKRYNIIYDKNLDKIRSMLFEKLTHTNEPITDHDVKEVCKILDPKANNYI